MPVNPDSDPDAMGAKEREAPLDAKYKMVEPDQVKIPGKCTRAATLPGKAGIPPISPRRGDAAGLEADTLVSATRERLGAGQKYYDSHGEPQKGMCGARKNKPCAYLCPFHFRNS